MAAITIKNMDLVQTEKLERENLKHSMQIFR